jgi:methyl-accepting chemotaxis protein
MVSDGLKVGSRLCLAFALVLALLVSVLLFGINRMALMNEALTTITQHTNKEIAEATSMRLTSSENSITFRNLIIDTDPQALDADFKKLNDGLAKFQSEAMALRALFDGSVTTTSAETNALDRVLEKYATIRPLLLELGNLGHDNKKREAIMLNHDTVHAVNAEMREAIDTLVRVVEQQGADSAAAASAAYVNARSLMAGLGAMAMLLAIGAAFLVTRSILRQLGGEPADVAAVAGKVAQGDFSTVIALQPGDTTSLFSSVRSMQQTLKERAEQDRQQAERERVRMEAERAAAAANMRIKNALDRVSAGVMLADLEGRVIYINEFAMDILRARAADICLEIPQFDVNRLIGAPITMCLPRDQHDLLTGLTGTQSVEFKAGDATLRTTLNPVFDEERQPIGTVVQWTDRTPERAIEDEVQATVEAAIDGNLTVRIREEGKEGFFKSLASGMNRLVGNTQEVLRTISTAAREVGTGAQEISRGNADLSQRTEEQASSLEETASSMEEMTAAVKNSADNAAQASQLALSARNLAERGGRVVQSAVAAMSEIDNSSKRIADITGVIDAIAFQTNLLALNAAVEAARAGEMGRGFAVVASEVRSLASRSAAAAKEIKQLIQESVAKVGDGTKFVDASGQVLQDIVEAVKKVTDVVSEIAASTQEQASGIEQVNKAVMSMDDVTQQNAALVEQATAAAQSLNQQAANLAHLMARFRTGGGSREGDTNRTAAADAPRAAA